MNILKKLNITENTTGWEDPIKRELFSLVLKNALEYCDLCNTTANPAPECKFHTPPVCQERGQEINIISKITGKSWSEILRIWEVIYNK